MLDYNYGKATKKNEDYAGDPSYNKQLIYLPKETVKSSLMLLYLPTSKIIKFVSFNLFYKHISRRYSNFENTEFVPGYGTFDCNAGIGFSMNRLRIDMKLMVNNVLNEDYKVVPGYPMPLRNFKLELDFKY
jgi:iron complex outermembrane receptor protein